MVASVNQLWWRWDNQCFIPFSWRDMALWAWYVGNKNMGQGHTYGWTFFPPSVLGAITVPFYNPFSKLVTLLLMRWLAFFSCLCSLTSFQAQYYLFRGQLSEHSLQWKSMRADSKPSCRLLAQRWIWQALCAFGIQKNMAGVLPCDMYT